ncbi:hypothetical protein Psal006b_03264 (plasmid) [Piscirickettsia salmonis]|uniref:Transposase n=1 Tax=Piscirickettsia salmonis TaxID=1238 RepID=A0AAC8VLN3_PISSA|nr:transposase [Piscirickettsia salmonis]QGO00227.1 hypothetical protein Psal006b_03264 [Piscirickettsia salmonis]QGO14489.1 hypothetical protein Psal010b_03243 [Piscirickettsia salmonis]QGO68374.1 hypothetical protein Psal073_03378 [Piscirickettsia salmonis]QGO71735.1 hypothetical protein Psal081_03248 [Piscirickettsia salmonis]
MARRKRFNKNQPFKWKHYSGDIILWLVRWYGRYALSYRDLKEIAAERGLELERSTICRWAHEYGGTVAKNYSELQKGYFLVLSA